MHVNSCFCGWLAEHLVIYDAWWWHSYLKSRELTKKCSMTYALIDFVSVSQFVIHSCYAFRFGQNCYGSAFDVAALLVTEYVPLSRHESNFVRNLKLLSVLSRKNEIAHLLWRWTRPSLIGKALDDLPARKMNHQILQSCNNLAEDLRFLVTLMIIQASFPLRVLETWQLDKETTHQICVATPCNWWCYAQCFTNILKNARQACIFMLKKKFYVSFLMHCWKLQFEMSTYVCVNKTAKFSNVLFA